MRLFSMTFVDDDFLFVGAPQLSPLPTFFDGVDALLQFSLPTEFWRASFESPFLTERRQCPIVVVVVVVVKKLVR